MGRYDDDGYGWPRYVPVAERKRKAAKHIAALKKKGKTCQPVVIEGRTIAKTFWGKSWCENLEVYSDFESRLPKGRTYVRNGSVIDLQITQGQVKAQVMGSELYQITIEIKPMPEAKWKELVKMCAGRIDSLVELLQGQFSKAVMEIMIQKENGLFPKPQEINMRCSCPDYAGMCKHIAAVLYGVGATLDTKPDWLFVLRHVNHMDLITSAHSSETLMQNQTHENTLDENELSTLFGIEMDPDSTIKAKEASQKSKKSRSKKPSKGG
jgi:uncharacterized Zn finger protein